MSFEQKVNFPYTVYRKSTNEAIYLSQTKQTCEKVAFHSHVVSPYFSWKNPDNKSITGEKANLYRMIDNQEFLVNGDLFGDLGIFVKNYQVAKNLRFELSELKRYRKEELDHSKVSSKDLESIKFSVGYVIEEFMIENWIRFDPSKFRLISDLRKFIFENLKWILRSSSNLESFHF